MGFLSASVSFIRYEVIGEKDPLLWENIPDLLKKYAFQEIEEGIEEMATGWVAFQNILDTSWKTASPYRGEYVVFGLRMDRRKLSPAIFKKYYALALEEFLQLEKEKTRYIPRSKKKEIRENVKIKLLSKTLPVPALFDIIWKYGEDIVYFSSVNKGVRQAFEELFSKSFSLELKPMTPLILVKRYDGIPAHTFDNYRGEVFI